MAQFCFRAVGACLLGLLGLVEVILIIRVVRLSGVIRVSKVIRVSRVLRLCVTCHVIVAGISTIVDEDHDREGRPAENVQGLDSRSARLGQS